MKTRSMYKAEGMCLDRISTLPQPILETILSLLPTKEAARTSILSREWRFKWTKLPKLEFYHYGPLSVLGLSSTRRNKEIMCKCCNDIQQILLLRQGLIQELTLNFLDYGDCLGLDLIMLHLSRYHMVKKLTLSGWDFYSGYKLPISLFLFHHLTNLDIFCLDLDHPQIFNGFGSLESLRLRNVGISTKTLLNLLSNSPSLKTLTLLLDSPDGKCTVNELFECLPVIEHLTAWPHVSKWLVLDLVPRELPTSLIHLKHICFEQHYCLHDCGLAFLLVLIKCSPNLEKIKLECYLHDACEEHSIVWEKYSDVWLEHLNEVETGCFRNSKPEMEFVKFILTRSPELKKVSIHIIVDRNQELKMVKTLLQAPRVSPVVITVWGENESCFDDKIYDNNLEFV